MRAATRAARSSAGLRPSTSPPISLYGVTVFVSASLVFWVQPLAVRGLLPAVGGAPLVWNTAMLFFQSMLLAGYLLAHLMVRQLAVLQQMTGLAALWVVAVAGFLGGDAAPFGETPPQTGTVLPALWLLGTLAFNCGPACLAVSMLTPLTSAWFAKAKGNGTDPYVLYGVSNVGSIGVLLVYPFVLEPLFGVALQIRLWTAVFALLWLLLLALGLRGRREAESGAPVLSATAQASPSPGTALRILLLALLPSALLYGVTLRLSTDVAAAPLLWVLPLALYLGTYALAFGGRQVFARWRHTLSCGLVPVALVLFAVFHGFASGGLWWCVFHLAVFAIVAFFCHGLLWELRPGDGDLTRFFVLLSAGGLLGGVLSILVWPLLFPDVWEYPLLFSLAALLLPARAGSGGTGNAIPPSRYWARCLLSVALVALAVGGLTVSEWPVWVRLLSVAVLAACLPGFLALRRRPVWLAAALLYVSFTPAGVLALKADVVAMERTWFGVYRIMEMPGDERVPGRVRLFFHGTTLHGFDWLKPDGSVESRTGYHAPEGPHGDVMRALRKRGGENLRMGVVGLGAGSLLCYARPGDTLTVWEIDAAVVRLARSHFAALSNCGQDAEVKVGDGRLLLAREAAATLDALFLDAFTSGSIPVHLLTLEAFRDYLRVLAPDGVLVLHVSSRHLDLEPLLGLTAGELGLAGAVRRYEAPPWSSRGSLPMTTHLVVLAREPSVLQSPALSEDWQPLALREPTWWRRAWSDDRAGVVPYLR